MELFRAENVSLAILSSDLLSVILQHLKNKVENIRFYSATIFVLNNWLRGKYVRPLWVERL